MIALVLLLILWPVSRRRRRYLTGLEKMRAAKDAGDHNLAVALNYAYASRLMQETARDIPDGFEDMVHLNELARFSDHKLTADDTAKAEAFTAAVISECRKSWTRAELLKNHYWRWIV